MYYLGVRACLSCRQDPSFPLSITALNWPAPDFRAYRAVARASGHGVVDHLGEPDEARGPGRSQQGYTQLLQHLKEGSVYVKLSSTYRFDQLPDLDDYAVEILREAPDRVVWASDWPHTGGVKGNSGEDRTKV